jgi:hypothetical protein
MASAVYPKAKESFLGQNPSIDLDTDTIRVRLVNITTDYTYSSSHQYISSVTAYAGTTDATLGSKTITSGVFDAADAQWTAVAISGTKTIGACVIYKDTLTASTSPVIAYIEFTAITPNSGNITVAWDNGGNGIFALV